MTISSKNVNQNLLKVPYFFENICKNSPSSGGSASRFQLVSGGWGLCPQTPFLRGILLTPTVLLKKRFKFVALLNDGFKEEILAKTFFWRTHYTFGNILF